MQKDDISFPEGLQGDRIVWHEIEANTWKY